MTDAQSDIIKSNNKVHKRPLIIRKEAIKTASNYAILFRRVPGVSRSGNLIKEDIIYKAQDGDFFKGKYPDLCIINEVDVVRNSSRTAAVYTVNGSVVNLTSDAVVKTIGQERYDQVFTALCCVINQELKIKGILALLSNSGRNICTLESKETQTYESSFKHLLQWKQRIRHNKRKRIGSYAVETVENKESKKLETVPKKVIVDPADFMKLQNIKLEPEENDVKTESTNKSTEVSTNNTETDDTSKDTEVDITENSIVGVDKLLSDVNQTNTGNNELFPELRLIVDEDSNISEVGSLSNLSIGSCFSLSDIENKSKSILNFIEAHTEYDSQYHSESFNIIECVDGSMIKVKGNPDPFHIATPEILKDLSPIDQKKIMLHQAYLDWKFCLQRNEDNNLPIHLAVLDNDVELLKRQCLVLKSRHESVDIPADGNLTALQMSIFQDCPECTVVLLAQGADLLVKDDEARTPLHLAAEIGAQHVEAILEHCRNNARKILKESDALWTPELADKCETKLVDYLLTRLNTIFDNQGYTPLMLASKLGNAAAVELLVAAAPSAVNMAMPSCGNTALYIAAGAACTEAANRGDKTTIPENYKRVVECLVEHGADLSIENNSGSNVNHLLAEMSDVTLSSVIAVKLSSANGCGTRVGDYMLLKDGKGAVRVANTKGKTEVVNELKVCKPKKVYNAKTNKITEAKIEAISSKNAKENADTVKSSAISSNSSNSCLSSNASANNSSSKSSLSSNASANNSSSKSSLSSNASANNSSSKSSISSNASANNGSSKSSLSSNASANNSSSKSSISSNASANNSSSKSSISSNASANNSSSKSSISSRSDQSHSEISKPVIIKNVPVITKIVSFDNQKPVLVKSITSKTQSDEGLQTQITAKTSVKVHGNNDKPIVPLGTSVGSKTPQQYLKILPKTGSLTTGVGTFMHFRYAAKRQAQSSGPSSNIESSKPKFCKILPKPGSKTTSPSLLKSQSAAKRPERESKSSAPIPIKKPKKEPN